MKYAKIATIVLIVVTVSLIVWQLLPNNKFSLFSGSKNAVVKPPLFAVKPTSGTQLPETGTSTPQLVPTSVHFQLNNLNFYHLNPEDTTGRTALYTPAGAPIPPAGALVGPQNNLIGAIGIVKSVEMVGDDRVVTMHDPINDVDLPKVVLITTERNVEGVVVKPTTVYMSSLTRANETQGSGPQTLVDSIDQIEKGVMNEMLQPGDALIVNFYLNNNNIAVKDTQNNLVVNQLILRRI